MRDMFSDEKNARRIEWYEEIRGKKEKQFRYRFENDGERTFFRRRMFAVFWGKIEARRKREKSDWGNRNIKMLVPIKRKQKPNDQNNWPGGVKQRCNFGKKKQLLAYRDVKTSSLIWERTKRQEREGGEWAKEMDPQKFTSVNRLWNKTTKQNNATENGEEENGVVKKKRKEEDTKQQKNVHRWVRNGAKSQSKNKEPIDDVTLLRRRFFRGEREREFSISVFRDKKQRWCDRKSNRKGKRKRKRQKIYKKTDKEIKKNNFI